jgi:hypothetical protein
MLPQPPSSTRKNPQLLNILASPQSPLSGTNHHKNPPGYQQSQHHPPALGVGPQESRLDPMRQSQVSTLSAWP